jgi:hypothetical protein
VLFYVGRIRSKASRIAIAPSPTAAATRFAEPARRQRLESCERSGQVT